MDALAKKRSIPLEVLAKVLKYHDGEVAKESYAIFNTDLSINQTIERLKPILKNHSSVSIDTGHFFLKVELKAIPIDRELESNETVLNFSK